MKAARKNFLYIMLELLQFSCYQCVVQSNPSRGETVTL